jgi:shikimate kinase
MRITISGPPGSGTTSLARYLAGKYGLEFISAGEVFRRLAREHGMDLAEFGRFAESDPSVDRMIDARQKEIGEASEKIIVEGRLSGRMIENADLRIWLAASLACRAKRIAGSVMGWMKRGARLHREPAAFGGHPLPDLLRYRYQRPLVVRPRPLVRDLRRGRPRRDRGYGDRVPPAAEGQALAGHCI